jgi:predicted outer membrane protein
MDNAMSMLRSATNFDSTFIAHEIDGHQKTLDELNMMMGQAQNDSLRTLIQGKIGSMASSGTSGSGAMGTGTARMTGNK